MKDSHDQTSFAAEEPIFESTEELVQDPVAAEEPQKPDRKKLILIAAVGVAALLTGLLALVIVFIPQDQQPQRITSDLPQPTPLAEPTDELVLQFRDTQQALQDADPGNNEYAFPPIEWEIFLEESR